MSKRVLSVGQCGPDNATLKKFLKDHFEVEYVTADGVADTLEAARATPVDLVLINRKLDADYSDGMAVLAALKAEDETAAVPAMIVSNYDDAQEAAVAAGAEPGFGKLALNEETASRLRAILG